MKTTFVYTVVVTSRPELTFKVLAGSLARAGDSARAYVRQLYSVWGGFAAPPDFSITGHETASYVDEEHLES